MTQHLTISPLRPADISMDYERLRLEGVSYLETLATEIWTDFNVHDPGITILEVLCYAITDLGYRANLPLADLLAGAPGDQRRIFFPITDVLPNEPVTERDYRKLFIDVAGVKNAWLYRYHEPDAFIPGQPTLNGLYDVLIELEEGIFPDSKAARRIEEAIRKRYHAHRNLGEDLARVRFVRDCPLCICLDVELEMGVHEAETLAQVFFNLQQFLAPRPRFYSFRELRERGMACEAIYNGPLLQHGFLPDEELDNAPLRRRIYKSDLLGVIMGTPGVVRVKDLLWRKASEDSYSDTWCLDVTTCGLMRNEDPCTIIYQPYLDPCCSRIRVTQGVLTNERSNDDFKEELALLNLLADVPVDKAGHEAPAGKYRKDLTDYLSIQHEFPGNYAIGEHDLSQQATALRRAQRRQLQAFLLFFDQILAAYLQQLAEVRNLLAVDQTPDDSTYFFQTLCEVPGMADLVADFAVYELTADHLAEANAHPALSDHVKEQLADWSADWPITYHSKTAFAENMQEQIGSAWDVYRTELTQLFQAEADGDHWEDYCSAGEGAYFSGMQTLTEGSTLRQLRRNQIIDHLLARFGEQFTGFSLQLFQTRVDRENDPSTETMTTYLQRKADFLRELPTLAAERARGYNYRAKLSSGAPDVWNTDNVSGLERRVNRYLGLEDQGAYSLLCDPDYDLKIHKGESATGLPTYQLRLVLRENQQILLESKVYTNRQKRKAYAIQEELRKELDQLDRYTITGEAPYRVVYEHTFTDEQGRTLEARLASPGMSEAQATDLLARIKELVRNPTCDLEGFHLIEHILLRPNDPADAILDLPAGSCLAEVDDAYSFIVTIVLPDWPQRFRDPNFRRYLEQAFRREAPAHIGLRFCWVDVDTLQEFERPYQRWREEMARCTPDECQVNVWADQLIDWLNSTDCTCPDPLEIDDSFCVPPQ